MDNPIKNRLQVIATALVRNKCSIASILADRQRMIEGPKENNYQPSFILSSQEITSGKIHLRVTMKICTDRMTRILLIWNPAWP